MRRSFPILFLFLLIGIVGLEPWMPLWLKATLVAMSLTLKSLLMFILPFMIFCLIFKAITSLVQQASKLILGLALMVCCSNFIATWLSHYVGLAITHFDWSIPFPEATNEIKPMWDFTIAPLLKNEQALLAGMLFGFILGTWRPQIAAKLDQRLDHFTQNALKAFILMMPVFIMGFVVKLQAEGALKHIIKDYCWIFLIIGISQYTYIACLYFISTQRWQTFSQAIKNMLPAAMVGFSTMSSAAAMPLTLAGVSKQAKNPKLAQAIVPATVNNHLMGDCFAIPILAFAILKTFGLPLPSVTAYLIFTGYFVLAKFSVAAVPGGGIIVMLPVLEKYLGFEPMMLSLITALYILFDPIITSANVMGNGGFAMLIDKISGRVKQRPPIAQEG